jgi:glycine/D-amino acid oxidase-like deaminating enzyme
LSIDPDTPKSNPNMTSKRGDLTRQRRLRAGQSIWQSRPMIERLETKSSLAKDMRCEVLVIGAGISGALIAETLSEAGLQVAIADRRRVLQGSTPASTALLQYEIDTPLSVLSKRIGKDRAQRIWRRSRLALDALRERSRRLGINADLVNRDSLYLDGDVLDAAKLEEEGEARRAAGFEVHHLDAKEVARRYGIRNRTALLGFDNLAADPRRLAAGFLATALSRGAVLHEETEIVDVTATRDGVTATSAEGFTIDAKTLVFATGYELPKSVPHKGHSIISTWAFATVSQTNALWNESSFIWEASDPYLYVRVGPGRRVICGGEDEEFADEEKRDALMDGKIETLQRKLGKLMPHIDTTADFRWCGNFGASSTGTPSIGPVPGMPNCHAVLGYGGNGITFSMLAAQLLRIELTGGRDPDRDLFSFSRDF